MKKLKSTDPFRVTNDERITITDLVDEKNEFHKNIEIRKALLMAREAGLDLVCFAETGVGDMSLCKLVDYDKWRYQSEKKRKQNNKQQKHEIKEIRFSPVISEHDIEHKVKHAKEFIEHGHDLNLTMKLKRRQNSQVAVERMSFIISKCEEFATVADRKDENGFILVKLSKKTSKEKI